MKRRLEVENILNDCAVIRTTFQTLDLFPVNDPIRAEMFNIITDAQDNLIQFLHELTDAILIRPETLEFDFEAFKTNTLELMQSGYPKRGLNRLMKTEAFPLLENDLYYFPLAGTRSLSELKAMPAPRFTALLLDEIADSANMEANYVGKPTFDRNVFEKCIGFLFLQYAACDPRFYKNNTEF